MFVYLRKKQYLCARNVQIKTDIMAKGKYVVWLLCVLCISACGPSDEELAQGLVDDARALVQDGQWRQARLVLDSVHITYPREVAQRRLAKALEDSVVYLESQATKAYADTILPPLLVQADKLLKQFRYEKNEKYEDHGRYVHRLLATGSNTSRNFLQAYVRDDRQTTVKSYYFGSHAVKQQYITLSADGDDMQFAGANHAFEAEGWHEVMSLEDDRALEMLNFISSHINARIRVHGQGEKSHHTWVYYLNDKEKEALSATYELGWLMKDILRVEQMQKAADTHIQRYERKYMSTNMSIDNNE